MARPIQARIDFAALAHNLGVVRQHTTGSRVMAVIKADAYGHGMLRTASALRNANGYAVLRVEEGIALRDAGYTQTILLLEGFFTPDELPLLAHHRLTAVIHCFEQIDMLAHTGLPGKLDIFLKINTGMNRLGFTPEAFQKALARLQACSGIGKITLATHFARADEESGVAAQLERFNRLTAKIALPHSLANSAAILRHPQAHGDWVRPGIMLYGASPLADIAAQALDLQPVMTLQSRIIAVQKLNEGECAGYGAAFKADKPMRIGVVACGYADGYPRHAPTGTPILVEGIRTRTLGRVSMDMLFVDLTDIPHAHSGALVTLWGEGLPVDEVAAAAGTISYELLCALGQRVPVVEM